jgi:hypothetical protein
MVIHILKLNRADIVRQRFLVQQVVQLAEEKNEIRVLVQLLGWPQQLPNLKSRRPPKGNDRSQGVRDCCFERERRGELGVIY